ncbi:MAG: TrbI F-type domain-containing protein [Novosphingobium sp.]|nr:TrbI F-type domain-containing protein [Novosphingobium sp.]
MRNILATLPLRRHVLGVPLASIVMGFALLAALLWGAWATRALLELESRELVTVQLSALVGEFVEAEARAGGDAEVTQRRIAAYLQAVDAAVARLAKDGRTVMVAEAVVAGETRDMTNVVRADVARRMGGLDDGPR